MVQTGVYVCGEFRPMNLGIIVKDHDGYYDIDIMSLHGGNPWIIQKTYIEVRELERRPGGGA